MRFTEHELTAALTGAAKTVLASQRKDVRRGRVDIDTVWDEMDRYQRFQLLDRLGAEILPVLVALPDVEVSVGTRPSYTDREVRDTRRVPARGRHREASTYGHRHLAHGSGADGARPSAAAQRSRCPDRARPSVVGSGSCTSPDPMATWTSPKPSDVQHDGPWRKASMSIITRGFRGRRRDDATGCRPGST